MTMSEAKLDEPFTSYLVLGLGLLFLGKQETVEPTLEVCRSLNERISRYAVVTLTACAYAGTGNVLKIQAMMALCGEHETDDEPWKVRIPFRFHFFCFCSCFFLFFFSFTCRRYHLL